MFWLGRTFFPTLLVTLHNVKPVPLNRAGLSDTTTLWNTSRVLRAKSSTSLDFDLYSSYSPNYHCFLFFFVRSRSNLYYDGKNLHCTVCVHWVDSLLFSKIKFNSTINVKSVFIINFVFCKFMVNDTLFFTNIFFRELDFSLNVPKALKLRERTSLISTFITPSLSSTFWSSCCDFVFERMCGL